MEKLGMLESLKQEDATVVARVLSKLIETGYDNLRKKLPKAYHQKIKRKEDLEKVKETFTDAKWTNKANEVGIEIENLP